jgi:selenocysteine lyase/cysteine desulfurase
MRRMYDRLLDIYKVEVYGHEPKNSVSLISFNIGELNPHDLALALMY